MQFFVENACLRGDLMNQRPVVGCRWMMEKTEQSQYSAAFGGRGSVFRRLRSDYDADRATPASGRLTEVHRLHACCSCSVPAGDLTVVNPGSGIRDSGAFTDAGDMAARTFRSPRRTPPSSGQAGGIFALQPEQAQSLATDHSCSSNCSISGSCWCS